MKITMQFEPNFVKQACGLTTAIELVLGPIRDINESRLYRTPYPYEVTVKFEKHLCKTSRLHNDTYELFTAASLDNPDTCKFVEGERYWLFRQGFDNGCDVLEFLKNIERLECKEKSLCIEVGYLEHSEYGNIAMSEVFKHDLWFGKYRYSFTVAECSECREILLDSALECGGEILELRDSYGRISVFAEGLSSIETVGAIINDRVYVAKAICIEDFWHKFSEKNHKAIEAIKESQNDCSVYLLAKTHMMGNPVRKYITKTSS